MFSKLGNYVFPNYVNNTINQLIIKKLYFIYIFFNFSSFFLEEKKFALYYTSTHNLLLKKIIYKKILFSIFVTIFFSIYVTIFSSIFSISVFFFFCLLSFNRNFKFFAFDIFHHLLIIAILLYLKSFFSRIWEEIPFIYNEIAHIIDSIRYLIYYLFKLNFLIFTKAFLFLKSFLKETKVFVFSFEITYISISLAFLCAVIFGDISSKKIPKYLKFISNYADFVVSMIKNNYMQE
jgi:hypothetical protein